MPARTEKEKMLAGESYNLFDRDLAAERDTATGLLRRFNLAEAPSERQRTLQKLLGHIGRDSIIQPPFYCSYGRNTWDFRLTCMGERR